MTAEVSTVRPGLTAEELSIHLCYRIADRPSPTGGWGRVPTRLTCSRTRSSRRTASVSSASSRERCRFLTTRGSFGPTTSCVLGAVVCLTSGKGGRDLLRVSHDRRSLLFGSTRFISLVITYETLFV